PPLNLNSSRMYIGNPWRCRKLRSSAPKRIFLLTGGSLLMEGGCGQNWPPHFCDPVVLEPRHVRARPLKRTKRAVAGSSDVDFWNWIVCTYGVYSTRKSAALLKPGNTMLLQVAETHVCVPV